MTTDDDPPFVSGRSPSSTRAREERRNPPNYPDADRVALLARIVEFEFELAEFLDMAAREADTPDERADRTSRAESSRDRATRLCDRLREIGAGPPEPGDLRPQSLPVPAKELKHLAEDGRSQALQQNEQFLRDAYGQAMEREDTAEDLRTAQLAVDAV